MTSQFNYDHFKKYSQRRHSTQARTCFLQSIAKGHPRSYGGTEDRRRHIYLKPPDHSRRSDLCDCSAHNLVDRPEILVQPIQRLLGQIVHGNKMTGVIKDSFFWPLSEPSQRKNGS